jgi:hypothetical protein
MQVGLITVDGNTVGVIVQDESPALDTFQPDLNGYVPMGRASENHLGDSGSGPSAGHHGHSHHGHGGTKGMNEERHGNEQPAGKDYKPGPQGAPFHQGSGETDQAIQDAAKAHRLDPDFMRAVGSIESGMNPGSNAHRSTQYKGLYQIGRDEWRRVGQGNIYSAKDNAMGAARLFDANRAQFQKRFGREPTETELYMLHQQGLGFYTRGAMTNIHGNPYPGMRGPQTHESFEAGWGREVARRKAGFAKSKAVSKTETPPFDPETQPL